MKKYKLSWVDDFLNSIKPYVYMRLRDNVLIRMPNEAFKLNPSGARVIAHILDGGSVQDIINARPDSRETELQLERFFIDFSRLWNNEVCENYKTEAIHRTEFNIGYIQLPVLSEVALTYTCNIKCRFCYGDCTKKRLKNSWIQMALKEYLILSGMKPKYPVFHLQGENQQHIRSFPN